MAKGKFNFGSVRVDGQVIFGDNNRMEVQAGTSRPVDPQQFELLLRQLRAAIAAVPDRGPGSLPPSSRAQVNSCLLDLSTEAKKNQGEQNPTVLKRSVQVIADVLKAAPAALKSALELKSLFGL